MRQSVAIVTARAPDGTIGGAERLYEGLIEAFETAGWSATEFPFIFDETTAETIFEGYAKIRSLNLLSFDLVVSTKAPTYSILHPNHACWLIHTIRVFYDRFEHEHPEQSEYARLARSKIMSMDKAALSRTSVRRFSIGKTVSDRLSRFIGLDARVLYPPHPKANLFLTGDPQRYVFVASRLHRWKRLDLLVKAAKFLKSDVEIRIAGVGEERASLEELARGTRVTFLGKIDDDELRRQYQHSLAVPFMPVDEDYGYVAIEAFLSSKPLITTKDSGEPAEMVRASGGGVIVDPNPLSIARAIDDLATNSGRTAQMGKMGCDWVELLDWNNVVSALTAHPRQ